MESVCSAVFVYEEIIDLPWTAVSSCASPHKPIEVQSSCTSKHTRDITSDEGCYI